jgi:hypothetical protein
MIVDHQLSPFELLSEDIFFNVIEHLCEPRISFLPNATVSVSFTRNTTCTVRDLFLNIIFVSKEVQRKCYSFVSKVPLYLNCYYGSASTYNLSIWIQKRKMKLGRICVDCMDDVHIQNIMKWSNTNDLRHVALVDSDPRLHELWVPILLKEAKHMKRLDVIVRKEQFYSPILASFANILEELHLTLTSTGLNDGSIVSAAVLEGISHALELCTQLRKLFLIPIRFSCVIHIRSKSLQELVLVGSAFNILVEKCSCPRMEIIKYEFLGERNQHGMRPIVPFDRNDFDWTKNETKYEYVDFTAKRRRFYGLHVPSSCIIRMWKSFRLG